MADWSQVLDWGTAVPIVEAELFGDWYRDPWGWPELKWLARSPAVLADVAERLCQGDMFHEPLALDVPKENFGHRPATLFHVAERIVYQASVGRITKGIQDNFRPWVFGWRERDGSRPSNADEWSGYRERLSDTVGANPLLLLSDISSFFGNVNSERLVQRMTATGAAGKPLEIVQQVLAATSRVPNRGGLPQRSFASAVLAHFYLGPVDDLLGEREKYRELIPTRWMDDFALGASSEAFLRNTQVELTDALRDVGLEPHAGKTSFVEGAEAQRFVDEIELSALDDELRINQLKRLVAPDVSYPEFERLHAEIVSDPSCVERTKLRFFATRLRKFKLWEFIDQSLIDAIARMPHGHDHLARMVRDGEEWRDLKDWFSDFVGSEWSVFRWSEANLVTMFPTDETPGEPIVDGLRGRLITNTAATHRNAVFLARLSAWDPENLRAFFLDRVAHATDWLELRAASFASLQAGASSADVRRLVNQHRDGRVLSLFLEDVRYRAPKFARDFR